MENLIKVLHLQMFLTTQQKTKTVDVEDFIKLIKD